MAKAKKPKPKMLTLEEQLAEHDRDAPGDVGNDAYGQAYKRQWRRQRADLIAAIGRRDRKRLEDDVVEVVADDPEDTKKRRRNLTRCKQSEAFRHNRLTAMQQEACREMAIAWQGRRMGRGPSRSRYGMMGGGEPPDTYLVDQKWQEWCAAAVDRRIMVGVVIDCIAEPKTLTQIERDHRLRRGQALDQFCRGLDLWAELRGWMRGPRMHAGPHLLPEGVTPHLDK